MTASGPVWIGVDVGTQSARALAVDDDGRVLAGATHPLRSRRCAGPRGETRHEQNPREWTDAIGSVLGSVASRIEPDRVRGIAVDATSGTVVLVDGGGTPVTAGVMYDDARGSDRIEQVHDAGAGLWRRLGHRPGPTWALPTVLALLDEHPGHRVAHQNDVVNAWLTGRYPIPTDTSTALKTGYDVASLRWPDDVLSALGVDPAALPDVVAPGTVLGGLGTEASAGTGLAPGTPVLAGMTDGCAAQIGAGAVTPGAWNTVLGTTLVVKGVTGAPVHDPAGAVYSHRSPQPGRWLPGGACNAGAGVLSRLVDPSRFDAITERLLAGPPIRVPLAYPLPGRGERFPVDAPDLTGFWCDADTPRAPGRDLSELVAAVGEVAAFAALADGVAFVERWCYERLVALGAPVDGRRTISGGATANAWWNQRRADVLGVALHVPVTAEPAFGMAVLAAAAASSDTPDLDTAAGRMCHTGRVVAPRPDPGVDERYAAFRTALAVRHGVVT